MRFSSILVLTYGRTGSTLLTGVLNTILGVLVRGENQNMFAGLFQGYSRLRSTRALYGEDAHSLASPFFGTHRLCEERYLTHARALARDQLVTGSPRDARVYGFKETRYTRALLEEDGVGPLGPYLDFLARLFPDPAFIVLTRNHRDVASSSFWRRMSEDQARQQMAWFDQDVAEWSAERTDVFRLSYEDIFADGPPFATLFDFLDTAYDEACVRSVLERQHSNDNRQASVTALPMA